MKKKIIVSIIFVFIVLGMAIFNGINSFDLSNSSQETIKFKYKDDFLEGTLFLPKKAKNAPIVLIVHGDGPQDRFANQAYLPFFHALLERRIGVFSWDKPGIGKSKGNWLAQRMDDRAREVEQALKKLRSLPKLKDYPMGFLGFSQAGWVIPKVNSSINADFLILVGAAINWRQQSLYYTRQRLTQSGASAKEIELGVKKSALEFDSLFSKEKAQKPCKNIPCSRGDFERRNAMADSSADIIKVHTPVMVLSGADDLNVNPNNTQKVWQQLLPKSTKHYLKKVPNATHGLLRANLFNYQLANQWPIYKKGLFFILGEYAYAPEVIDMISSWARGDY